MTDRRHPAPGAEGRRLVPPVDEDGRVAIDVRCRACRYLLRTRPVDAACPECGTAVAASLPADLLALADAGWQRRLRRGLWLALASWLAAIPLAGLWHLVDRAEAAGRLGPIGAAAANIALWGSQCGLLFGAVWLMTSPEPGRDERAWSARRLARLGVETSLLVGFASMLAGELLSMRGPHPPTVGGFLTSTFFLASNVLAEAPGLVGWTAMLVHGARIAERVPHDRLARWTRVVLCGYSISAGLALGAMASRTALNELIHRGVPVSPLLNKGIQLVDIATTGLVPAVALAGVLLMVWFLVTLRDARRA